MKVTLIGSTHLVMPERVLETPFAKRNYQAWLAGSRDTSGDLIAELAGRLCYDSFSLPNPSTATNAGYLENILKQKHFSVLEHGSATFLIEDVSRSLLMEMRTHRHASFSARSTRYVDESEATLIMPPALREHADEKVDSESGWTVRAEVDAVMEHSLQLYGVLVDMLKNAGATTKEAHEAAREMLPGATATEFVMTANHHAWREILQKRTAAGAAAEIREVSAEILRQLKELAPNIYQDM